MAYFLVCLIWVASGVALYALARRVLRTRKPATRVGPDLWREFRAALKQAGAPPLPPPVIDEIIFYETKVAMSLARLGLPAYADWRVNLTRQLRAQAEFVAAFANGRRDLKGGEETYAILRRHGVVS